MKKTIGLIVVAVFLMTVAGCCTSEEVRAGKCDPSCQGIAGVDNWIKKNLW